MKDRQEIEGLTTEIALSAYRDYIDPVLIARTNGVGGKLAIAAEMDRYDTIGRDCVAVCMNDLAAAGAKPLFFHDNISCVRPKAERIADLEKGLKAGCDEYGVAFSGSELMELPETFGNHQYDVVGFAVGILDRSRHVRKTEFREGDVIMGLASNGLHNNGYVAAKKKLFLSKETMEIYYENLGGTLGDLLMQPTKCYLSAMEAIGSAQIEVKSCIQVAHGGLDTALRNLLDGKGAVIKQLPQSIPPIYNLLHRDGNIPLEQLRGICNMGIGMLFVVSEDDEARIIDLMEEVGEESVPLGLIEAKSKEIRYI